MNIGDKYIYDWVFRYNPYDKKWYAAKRDNYNELFSDIQSEDVLRSSDISTLVYVIKRTNGNKSKINKLLNNG